jgi:hypothetical protein
MDRGVGVLGWEESQEPEFEGGEVEWSVIHVGRDKGL